MPEHSAEHSDENSSENSTHRQSPRSQFLQTNAFAAKRKHSIKEEEEEEGQVGKVEAEEQFDGVDTDTIEAMRVDKSPSRAGNSRFQKGTFCILLDQYFTLK